MSPSRFSRTIGLLGLFTVCLVSLPPLQAAESPLLPEQIFPALKPILEQAAKQSPTMVVKHLDVLIAKGDNLQARSGLLPHVGGYYQMLWSRDSRADGLGTLNAVHNTYNFSVTQPLFHWGVLQNNARMGKIREAMSQENYEDAYRLLVQQIRSGYLGLIGLKVQLESAEFSAKLADQALASANDQVARKVMSTSQAYTAQVAAQRAHLYVGEKSEQYMEARQDFATLTGTQELEDAEVPDEVPVLQMDTKSIPRLLAKFLSFNDPQTAKAEVLRQAIQVDKMNYEVQRKRLYPNLDFVIGVSQDQQRYSALSNEYLLRSKYVGLQVNWNLFDGFATKGAIASALARTRQAEEAYQQYTKQSAQDAQRSARRVDLARQSMELSESQFRASKAALEFAQQAFQRGQASETDVENTRAGYKSALTAVVGDRINYLNQVVDFVAKIGKDPVLNVDLDQP